MNSFIWTIYAYFYDGLAELLPYQNLMKTVINSIKHDNSKIKILDAGCGTGNLELFMRRTKNDSFISVDAIDASQAMLKKAKTKFKKCFWVKFKLTDLNNPLPYDNGTFDNIVSINSLYATKNPKMVLKEFHSKLKVSGTLIIVNPKINPKITDVIREHIDLAMKKKGLKRTYLLLQNILKIPQFIIVIILNILIVKLSRNNIYHFFNVNDLKKLISNCGFRVLETKYLYGKTDIFVMAEKK